MIPGCTVKQPKAFTLIELLVVISVLTLLMAILMPALQRARRSAKEVVCVSNLRQLAMAALTYENDNRRLPLHYTENPGDSPRNAWAEQLASNANRIDRRKLWRPYIPDLKFMNCPLLKTLDITIETVPLQTKRVYGGYAFMFGFQRDMDEDGNWGSESTRWTRTDQHWQYRGQRMTVLAGDRLYRGVRSGPYYRINHGLRLNLPVNYVDHKDPERSYIVSVYEGSGAASLAEDMRNRTTSAYCFKDGSARKLNGHDETLIELEEPTDQSSRLGLQLVPHN